MSEFGKDMFQSSHRMLLGGLVNTTGVLFDENTPFHDKIFAFGVGAFITQKVENLSILMLKQVKLKYGLLQIGL